MLPPPVTISIAFVQGMLSGVQARGLACEPFLADAHIDPALLAQASARVTADQYVALFQSLTDRLDDDLLGFLARPLKRGSFALIVRAAAAEDTLGQAMHRIARSFGLRQSEVALDLVQAGPLAGLSLRFIDPTAAGLAITRLQTGSLPLAALADELGFADSAAFQPAFKHWTGSAPGAFRRRAG